jgi:putative transcriptional regulator
MHCAHHGTGAGGREHSEAVPIEKLEMAGIELPRAIAAAGVRKRRWIAPGIWTATIRRRHGTLGNLSDPLRTQSRIPLHGHEGMETICVMKGSFCDASGRYGVGDFLEIDETALHQPVAGPEASASASFPPKIRRRCAGFSAG